MQRNSEKLPVRVRSNHFFLSRSTMSSTSFFQGEAGVSFCGGHKIGHCIVTGSFAWIDLIRTVLNEAIGTLPKVGLARATNAGRIGGLTMTEICFALLRFPHTIAQE
jgi:hypothetical protein